MKEEQNIMSAEEELNIYIYIYIYIEGNMKLSRDSKRIMQNKVRKMQET